MSDSVFIGRPEYRDVKETYVYSDANQDRRHTCIEALFASDKNDIVCPRCGRSGQIRRAGTGEPHTRWDIVAGEPKEVTLRAQLWSCRACRNNHFQDPNFPFSGKGGTTDRFNEWIAQQLIQDPSLRQRDISDEFSIPVSTVNSALKNELKNLERYILAAAPVKELWLIPFDFHKKQHLAAVGRGILDDNYCRRMRIDPNSFVLLGLSPEYTIESIWDSARLGLNEQFEGIYCPAELISPTLSSRYNVIRYISPKAPQEIKKLLNLISLLNKKRISFDLLRLYLIYHNNARLEEIHYQGGGYFMAASLNSVMFKCMTSEQKQRYTLHTLSDWANSGIHYFCVDLSKLLEIFNIT